MDVSAVLAVTQVVYILRSWANFGLEVENPEKSI